MYDNAGFFLSFLSNNECVSSSSSSSSRLCLFTNQPTHHYRKLENSFTAMVSWYEIPSLEWSSLVTSGEERWHLYWQPHPWSHLCHYSLKLQENNRYVVIIYTHYTNSHVFVTLLLLPCTTTDSRRVVTASISVHLTKCSFLFLFFVFVYFIDVGNGKTTSQRLEDERIQ